VLSRNPPINPAFALAEAVWILAGRDEAFPLNFFNRDLPKFSGATSVYQGAYGRRLRTQFGLDQILKACDALTANPDSRQVVLQIWDPTSDFPNVDGSPKHADVPCNVCSMLKIRAGKLEWTQIMRSNDLHRGLPYNVVQFTILQEVIAGWLGAGIGSYSHWSDSLHIYCNDTRSFSCKTPRPIPLNDDTLGIERSQGAAIIDELQQRLLGLTTERLGESELIALATMKSAPIAYQNILSILGAESARRRNRCDQADELALACSNPQLRKAWKAWRARTKG
jgi:thymidylate synthase